MDRRNFFALLNAASCSYLVLRLTGCGPSTGASGTLAEDPVSVQIYDLVMEGHSSADGTLLGDNGVLKATTIRDFKQVTLDYVQDADGHTFTLKPEDFAKLLKGQTVSVTTTVAKSHTHEVRIIPARHASGSQPLTVKINADGTPVDSTAGTTTAGTTTPSTDKLYATFNEADRPNLYVSGSAELDETSVQFCLDSVDNCNKTPTLWHPLQRYAPRTNQQIFKSDAVLSLDLTQAKEVPLYVRGKTKKDATLLNVIMKLVRK